MRRPCPTRPQTNPPRFPSSISRCSTLIAQGPADAATIEAALIATVARYGEAPVVALRDDAVGAPMPESVPVRRKTVSDIRTGLDVIAFDDEVIAAWERVPDDRAGPLPHPPRAHAGHRPAPTTCSTCARTTA